MDERAASNDPVAGDDEIVAGARTEGLKALARMIAAAYLNDLRRVADGPTSDGKSVKEGS